MSERIKDRQINFRVDEGTFDALTQGARAAGLSLSAWLTQLGLTALGKSKLEEQLARISSAKTRRGRR
jgi:predicted HicB family RNase H-like nuclease